MAGRILHFGTDTCHRLPVFESAGYSVERCTSIAALREALEDGEAPDALILTETGSFSPREAVRLARVHSPMPLILFRETQQNLGEDGFDLVVPILHPPAAWLAEIATLIEKSQRLRAESRDMGTKPPGLSAAAAQIRAAAALQHAAEECARSEALPKPRVKDAKPGKETQ